MNITNQKSGFISILVVIIAVLVIGGGTFYAVKKNQNKAPVEVQSNTTVTENGEGSLRGLLALNKNLVCTYSRVDNSITNSGTIYITGNMMRGDFTTQTGASAAIESHMIRSGDDMYVWSGANGSKMNMSAMLDAKATTTASKSNGIDVDQKLNYKCVDWNKDESKFIVPASIKFMDLSSMMNINMDSTVKAGAKVEASSGTGQCTMCEQVSDGPSKEACKKALNCK